ncbi:hypothetical protein [Actinomadura sp. DC4]|uniref:hypothetical protein n=1 Tax=Actinomadura sp. DC4 TaxID=3055069 RepID=UPI0025B01CD9|nr:hypothetical protein [Actinomadura sp. DC4]MDN3358350.1 hypothetical protein [Actinomadura sp. DC4]
MGSFSKATGGAGAVIITAAMATPAMAAGPRIVRVACSAPALAAAITAANVTAGTVLRLASRCTYSITTPATAATGLPAVTGNITLVGGPKTTVRRDPGAAALFRVFDVAATGTLRIAGISILGGRTAGLGGAIQNAGHLVIRQATLAGNAASNGGAVANSANATATISRSLFSSNTTTSVGGGAFINFSTLTVIGSVLSANTAPINGGAVNTQPGGMTRLIQTTVAHNTSGGLGGGISNLGTLALDRTLVHLNRGSSGGGIATGNTNVTLRRSVVRNNIPDNCNPLNTVPGCVG